MVSFFDYIYSYSGALVVFNIQVHLLI
jgi:hypothetical protein